jgi:ADP-heptose:LPS heptosyltransferase
MPVEDLLRRLSVQFGLHALTQDSIAYRLFYAAIRALRVARARLRRPRRDNLRILRPTDVAPLPDACEIRHIVLIKGDHIGDLVVALPAIARLKRHFVQAQISLVCNPINRALAQELGVFDRVIAAPLDLRRGTNNAAERLEVIAALAALEPADIAIDMKIEASTRYALSHVAARLRIGFHDGSAFWNQPDTLGLPNVQRNTNLHSGDLLAMLADAAIARFEPDATPTLLRGIHPGALGRRAGKRLIGIATGAGQTVKLWPDGHFLALCRSLQTQPDALLVFFGGKEDQARNADIVAALSPNKTLDLTGRLSLPEFVGEAAALDLFIGLDTGATHIAAGLGIATICIFPAVTLQSRWLPRGRDVTVAINDVGCRVCDLRRREDCPNGHVCMTGITPALVQDLCRAESS